MTRKHAVMNALFVALVLLAAKLAFAQPTYPDMASYAIPSPAPTLPGGMDPFSPPVNSSTPAATTPTFAEWTRTGQPDDNLVATSNCFSTNTGADLGMDTNFLVYGQNSSGSALIAAKIQRLDAQKGVVTLDSSLPSWSMYLMWAQNSNGYGRPVAVNRTEAWWLGPNNGAVGASVSVYGRNLSYQNGTTTSWIYIQPSGQTGQWVTPTSVNPYCVTFTIPSNLSTGSYLVWVHNGHGQNYGWSGPLTLTVNTGPGWTGTQFNVQSYGATGNGTTDDTAAINSCTAAANNTPYSTVYFPAGTYLVSNSINGYNNQRWQGAGMSSTTILASSTFSCTYSMFFDEGYQNVEIDNMTLNSGTATSLGDTATLWRDRFGNNIRFSNVGFVTGSTLQALDLHGSSYIYLNNCNITSYETFLGTASQVFFNGCNFYGCNDANTLVTEWGGSQISMINCTAQDVSNPNQNPNDGGAGWAQGRFFDGNEVWGCSRDTYLGNNTTYNMAVRPGFSNQNTGEQLMWEGTNTYFSGMVTSATATTATFSTAPATGDTAYEACIVAGTGLGQHRPITAVNGNTITVSPAWNVPPDTTSQINIAGYLIDTVCYDNTLQGKSNYATDPTASAGVEPFGGALDFIAADNNISQVRTGISSWELCDNTSGAYEIDSTFFNLYTGNNISYSTNGLIVDGPFWDSSGGSTYWPGYGYFGNSFRRNTLNNLVYDTVDLYGGEGASLGTSYYVPTGVTWTNTVFENNTGSNMNNGIDSSGMNGLIANTIYYKNNLSMGTNSGSYAVDFAASAQQTPALRNDTWTSFPTTYGGGTLPGGVLEVPYRNFTVNGTSTAVS